MNELTTLVNALATFLLKFGFVGWIVLFIGVLLWKGRAIFDWLAEHLIKQFAPLWNEQRKLRIEQKKREIEQAKQDRERMARQEQDEIKHQRELQAQEQINTAMMWKDLILEYRKRLDDSEVANNRLQQKVFDVIAQNERLNAQVLQAIREYKEQNERIYTHIIEALRDVSSVLRAQTLRLDMMSKTEKE